MMEIFDNTVQLAVTVFCTIRAGRIAVRRESQSYFILASFYSTFALGLLFWLLYLILMNYTPKFFYVSDISWAASFLFLLLLILTISTQEEREYGVFVSWIVVALLIGITIFFCSYGDVLMNLIWCSLIIVCAFFSVRGFLYARKQQGEKRRKQYFYINVLTIIFMEFALWVASCFSKYGMILNLYFIIDFAFSLSLFMLLPAMERSVDK